MQNTRPAPGQLALAGPDVTRSSAALAAGFAAATRILTLDGMISVDCLRPGDRIVTRDLGMVRLVAVSSEVHNGVRPVILSASAVGHARPEVDLALGADQPLLLRDWRARALFGHDRALVPVRRLIDGTFIRLGPVQPRLRLFSLLFDRPHVIYAEGVECGTTV